MMEKQTNIPQLRFPEFEGDWTRNNFGDIVKINQGLQIPISERFLEQVEDSHFYITNEFLRDNSEKKYFIKNPPNSVICTKDDILMTRTGNTGMVVTNVEGAFHNNFFKIAYPKNVSKGFLYNFLKLPNTQKQIIRLAGTSTIPDLNHSDFYKIEFVFPNLDEQKKIAEFVYFIDEKIQALKKKHSLLAQYKKGLMQKLFSQELRFKDENGKDFPEWEEKQVKDLFKVTRGDVLAMSLVSDEIENDHIYPVYSSQTKNRGLAGYYNEYLFEDAITWTTDGAGAGDVNYREGKFYCTNVCGVLLSDEGNANLFIAELLNSVSRKYVSYVGNPKLMNNVMAEISIIIPVSVEEQQKISNFLKSLNVRIKQLEIEIIKIENWKKGLLQKMFV